MKKAKTILILGMVFCLSLSLGACNTQNSPLKEQAKSQTKDLMKDRNKDAIHCFDDTVMGVEGYNESAVNVALSEFSLRLFEENLALWDDAEKNVLISPTSVIQALGMTSYGAKGDTLTQLEEVLGVKRGYVTNHNSKYLENDYKELKLANSIWFTNDNRLTVNDAFLQFNEECYGAEVYETAFNDATVDTINDWVERNTNGMIKNILDEIPQDAVMYLINALVFEAEWATKYDSTQIWEDAQFTSSKGKEQKVDMMRSEESLYLADDNATGFVKHYKDGNYAFVALLPNEGVSVADYVKKLTGEHLQNLLANPCKDGVVYAHLPQFSYEYDVEMSELLKGMGMKDAFDAKKADFTAMATSTQGNIFINRVLHKTFIEVSPVGTKAGAATVVEFMNESATYYEKVYEVFLERPFLYMIVDCENNMPVFIGAVNTVE